MAWEGQRPSRSREPKPRKARENNKKNKSKSPKLSAKGPRGEPSTTDQNIDRTSMAVATRHGAFSPTQPEPSSTVSTFVTGKKHTLRSIYESSLSAGVVLFWSGMYVFCWMFGIIDWVLERGAVWCFLFATVQFCTFVLLYQLEEAKECIFVPIHRRYRSLKRISTWDLVLGNRGNKAIWGNMWRKIPLLGQTASTDKH